MRWSAKSLGFKQWTCAALGRHAAACTAFWGTKVSGGVDPLMTGKPALVAYGVGCAQSAKVRPERVCVE